MSIRKRMLAFTMVGGLMTAMFGTTAMAATISVNGTGNGYSAYRLLDLTTQLKDDCGHTEGQSHDKDCYIYNYTVADKYRDKLKAAVTASGLDLDIDNDGVLSDRELIDGMENMNAVTMRKFADNVWAQIKDMEADATADVSETEKAFKNVPQGYYLIYESDLGESPDSRSLVMLDTAGQEDITVSSKEDTPTLVKKILVADETQTDGFRRVDACDVNAGDTIDYEVTITMPENVENYKDYGFTVHDKGSGVKLTKQPEIYVDNVKAALSDSTHTESDDCMFHLNVNRGGSQLTVDGQPVTFTKDTVVKIRYSAVFDDTAYTTNSSGNTNEAWLGFSNDPYGTTEDETVPDKVAAFTYKFVNNKIDAHKNPLAGANFELYRQDGTNWVKVDPETDNTGLTATSFGFKGLDAGTYKLVEATVPDGYTKADDVIFEIRSEYDETSDNPVLKKLSVFVDGNDVSAGDDATFTIDLATGTATTQVVNERGVHLPGTGEMSLVVLYIGAAVLIIGGGMVLYGMNKKQKMMR